jgi:hypothetical protein
MTVLDLLPHDIRFKVMEAYEARPTNPFPPKGLREDLRLIPVAEAAGWRVTFRDDNWNNSASFQLGTVHVWLAVTPGTYAALHWRAADLIGGRYRNHRWHFGTLAEALEKEAQP